MAVTERLTAPPREEKAKAGHSSWPSSGQAGPKGILPYHREPWVLGLASNQSIHWRPLEPWDGDELKKY